MPFHNGLIMTLLAESQHVTTANAIVFVGFAANVARLRKTRSGSRQDFR